MSNISCLTREIYLKALAIIGITATWFAMMSAGSSCWLIVSYQPEMPASLIKEDD